MRLQRKIEIILKLRMQSILYIGPSTLNKLPNNLKIATNINRFKRVIKKYFLNKLSEIDEDIYSYD